MALYLKYRPGCWDEIVGQKEVVKSIRSRLSTQPPHTWLFAGKTGCGKTTVARILAKELGITESGYFELNVANLRGIDTVREIAEQSRYRAPGSPKSMYVFDEAHQITQEGQSALLKVLEEAPEHAYFTLCTTEPEKLLPTVRNRCAEYWFAPLGDEEMLELLEKVAREEKGIIDDGIMGLLIDAAGGSPRRALTLLEKSLGVLDDSNQVRRLLSHALVDEFEPDVARMATLLVEAFDKSSWKKAAECLRAVDRRLDIKKCKLALMTLLQKRMLGEESVELANTVLEIERSLYGINTIAGFIALIVKLFHDDQAEASHSGRGRLM